MALTISSSTERGVVGRIAPVIFDSIWVILPLQTSASFRRTCYTSPFPLSSLSLLCPHSPPLPFPNCPASPAARQDQVHTPTSKSLVNSGCKYNSRDAHARQGQATLATAESSSHVHGRAGGRKQCCLLQDRNKTFGESTSSSWLHVCCPSLYSCAHAHTHGAVGESSTCAGNLTSQCVLTMCTLRGVPSWRGMTRAICAKGGTG